MVFKMLKSSSYRKNLFNIGNIFTNAFINLQVEIFSFVLNFITILFYVFIFAGILTKQFSSYLEFLVPGLILMSVLASVSYQGLKIWSLGSPGNLMNYWLSLPYSISAILVSFTFMAVFSSIFYVLPLILLSLWFHFEINVLNYVIIVILSSIFLFFINFGLVLYLFKTNSFIIVFNVSQPLMLRISPVYYPLLYLPVFSLPLVFLNPLTWLVETLRGEINFYFFISALIIADIVLFKLLVSYWQKKIKLGEVQ